MYKYEFIQQLKNVKIVIGNGFDLECGLKSSYKDFFQKDEERYKKIENFYEDFRGYSFENKGNLENVTEFFDKYEHARDTNIWNYFFALNFRCHNKNNNWADIESCIEESLKDYYIQDICWPEIKKALCKESEYYSDDKHSFFYSMIKYKIGENTRFHEEFFYSYLLKELKQFEKIFGQFVNKLQYSVYNNAFNLKCMDKDICNNSKYTIEQLVNLENISNVDSFNYTDLRVKELEHLLYHINGNYEMPIFGIDSSVFPADDIRSMFSKTSRRIDNSMFELNTTIGNPFENVVIFGHSLNKADYNYFFALFDKLNIINLETDAKIIFAFAIYDETKEETIRSNLRSNIQKMFESYSKYKGNTIEPGRLLDALTTQNKVIMYEIEHIKPLYNIN